MYYTYVLYSKKFNKIYIGYTGNLEQRLRAHNVISKKGYTKRYRPWIIAFFEEYETKKEAMDREKILKSGKGSEWVWKKINDLGLLSA